MAKSKAKNPRLNGLLNSLRKHWKRTTVIVALLFIVFYVYKRATSLPSGTETYQVKRQNLSIGFTANGQIKAKKTVDLRFLSPGKVAWINVVKGEKIKAWTGVAGLDTIPLNAIYEQSLNNYRNYQAIADSVLDSVQGHTSDETYAQRAIRTTAEVNRDNAYNTVLAAQDNLRNAVLVTPISGTVVEISDIIPGINLSSADAQSKYIRITDLSSLYFEAEVDEVDFSKVKADQKVTISIDAYPNKSCEGIVSYINQDGQQTTGGVVSIPTEVTFKNCDLNFVQLLNGQANFVSDELNNILVIPNKYIVIQNGENYVWKQDGTNPRDKKLIPIMLGVSSSMNTEVTEGLSEGDIIIYIP